MADYGTPAIDAARQIIQASLEDLAIQRPEYSKAPLNKSILGDAFRPIDAMFSQLELPQRERQCKFIEVAVRDCFANLLASTTIEDPSFVKVWHLLDLTSILSDDTQCPRGLLFWLIEDLLDSQLIAGCRKVFDYLESRRERITAKHWKEKFMPILRSCNELLRRLSRAEDTAFCGRVFIFLFQSFPLGDKSSVNLRGEYHLENVTTFDAVKAKTEGEQMDIDSEQPPPEESPVNPSKGVRSSRGAKGEKAMSPDELYPIFWTLQQGFNQPKLLFDANRFADFKTGLQATMVMFRQQSVTSARTPSKAPDDAKQGFKRKRGQADDDLANTFNPKYLTSRDLFELEISDLSFRRHITVQALIVLDFLLSLSPKAKEKFDKQRPATKNDKVTYEDLVLSEEDTTWAQEMKTSVSDYLKSGPEGAFFYRMVETVLSRDKNWVRWKIESCPSISKPAFTAEDYVAARTSIRRNTTFKKRSHRGILDLSFLQDTNAESGLERFKDPSRYTIPSLMSFKSKISDDDFNIDMARDNEQEKHASTEAKASNTWRALRIASMSKLVAFDRIESWKNIDEIFRDDDKAEEVETAINDEDVAEGNEMVRPKDQRPIVISGPSGVGKGTLIAMLLEKHGKLIGKKVSHTTRAPREDEAHAQHYYFVTKEEYDELRDEGDFLEFNNFDGNDYGTSHKVLNAINESGRIPLMEMDYHGIQQLKDKEYEARFIFLAPPHISDLQLRLEGRGTDSGDKIMQRMEIAKEEIDHSNIEGFYDKIIINDDKQAAYDELERYVFGIDETGPTNGTFNHDAVTPLEDVLVEGESQSKPEETSETIPETMEVEDSNAAVAELVDAPVKMEVDNVTPAEVQAEVLT